MKYHDMQGIVLKYLEHHTFATFDELFKECDIYDWTWSVVDMESLIVDMKCNKQIRSYAVYVNEILAVHLYVPYDDEVQLIELNEVK